MKLRDSHLVMSAAPAGHPFTAISFHALAATLLAVWFTASSARAASATWLATPADANWATASNWNPAATPGDLLGTNTNPDTATFNATVSNGFGTTSPVVIDAGRNLNSITFSTAAASAYVIGTTGGNALLLSSGGTIQTDSSVVNVQTVNAPLVLEPATSTTAGTYTFSSNAASATHVLNFGGAISTGVTTSTQTLTLTGTNTGANTLTGALNSTNAADGLILNKLGAGAWTLGGNASSTLDKGRITVNGGTLNFGSATEAPTLTISALASGGNAGLFVISGNFNMNAGNLTANAAEGIVLNGTNTYTQTGGTFSTNGLIEFANGGGISTVNISGGSLITTNGNANDATDLAVRGTTTVNLSGTGTFTTPTLNMSTSQIGNGAATSTFNLDGGTLVAGQIIKGTGGSTGTQTFNFNGGSLRSSASSTTYMTGLTNAFVKAGGAVIDTQAFNVTIGQDLLTDVASTGGGLTKTGSGTLTLTGTNTYTGATQLNAGTLSLGDGTTNTSLADTAAVVIGTDPAAILYLNYTGTDTVASLTINGVAKSPGVYSSSDSSGLINGTGTLTVLTGPASPYSTWANSFLPGNNVSNPEGDNDNDGLVNLQEFAFGLDPTSGSSFNPITVQLNETTGQFSYQRRAGSGLTYKILTSTTNATGSWTENTTASQVVGATDGNGNQTVVVTLTGAPLAEPLFVRVTAAETRTPINVKDFGAIGDGLTDDTAAINAAIVVAKRQVAGAVVSLPSGRYKTALGTEKSILITGADGLTFQGEGDTTIVSGDLVAPVFRIVDSNSVTVRKISIDHDPLNYTQGTITSVDIPNMTCEVSMDPGYPAPNDPSFIGSQIHPFVFPEKNYYQLDRHWPNPSEMVKTGEHTWSLNLEGPPNIENWPGKRFFIYSETSSHAFVLSNLRDTTLEDVNYWGGGANAGFYITGLEGTTTFRRFVIGVPPGSNRLYSCAGGGQVSGLRGKLLLDQCDFSKIDDDGIDIFSNYTRVIEQRDARTLEVQAKNSDYRTGDRVELWDWQHKKIRSEAIITTATSTPAGTFVITLDRDVVTERVGVGVGMSFSRESMIDGIDRLINVATVGQETIIRDSKFQVFRAKCLDLRAANCIVERCIFSNSFGPAIFAAPDWYFEEGSSIRNLTVRDCTFTDNNHASILIGASPLSGVPAPLPVVSNAPEDISHDSTNILIEGNSFSGFGTTPSVFQWIWPVGPAITITNAAQVVIRGNTFGPVAASAPSGTPTILVEKSIDVQIMDNQGISSATSWLAAPGNANWATASNWNSAAVPGDILNTNANPDNATFNATVSNGFGTTSPVVIDAGRNLKSITFSTAAASAYVIGTTGGNALLLSSGGTIQTNSDVVNVQTVNAPIELEPATSTTAGAYNISSNAASATHVLNLGGAITAGVTTSTQTLTLTGPNTGANTLSGTLSSTNAADGLILDKTGAGAWTLGGNASSTLAKGRITVNGGTLNFGSATEAPSLTISALASGSGNKGLLVNSGNSFNMNAGNLTVNGSEGLVLNGNNDTYTQTGGTFSTNGLIEFANYGGNSTVNISGGSFTTSNGGVNATNLAVRGTTTVNLSGTGTFIAPTLNMTSSQLSGGAATSTFNLDGGTLVAGQIIKGTNGSTGTQTFNFNGGTLRSSASSTTYMTGLTNAFVKAGGAVIDTQAFNVTIAQDLLTDVASTGGGLTKSGSGTLTLTGANTYTGATLISGGTLQVGGSLGGAVTVDAAGTLAPGPASGIGSLTLASPLTVAGKLSFRIDRSNAQNADLITAPSLALAGVLSVSNIGPALQAGDSFKLFDISGSFTQSQVTFSLPTLPSGLRWDDGSLLTTGILKVALVPPVATAQSVTTAEDTAKAITLTGTDLQGSPLTYTIVTQPASGTFTGMAPNLTYTPAANFNGTDSFTFKVNDGALDSPPATVSISVTAVNDVPVFAINPFATGGATESLAYTGQTLAGKATDADAGDTITYSKVSGPAWLAVAPNGTLSGTPITGSTGLNSFSVRATDSASATATATLQITVTAQPLPLPWLKGDIGTGMLAGSVTHNAGTFTQAGSGVIGSTSDRLNFTYQTLTGDGEIIARISVLQDTGTSSRVGVMIRDTLAANSKQIFMGMTGTNAYRWVRRTATGGTATSSNSSTGTVPNTWVRLVRSGTTITAYKSSNGTTWTSVGSTTGTTFASTCYIGLAVSSGSTTTLNTSQFSNVSVNP